MSRSNQHPDEPIAAILSDEVHELVARSQPLCLVCFDSPEAVAIPW
ncbi:MAG: hypothetical protein MUF72_17445 [Elainella sp. Prado103]|nr:hypothetical protein [Elainella sp. Prado103]